MTTYTRYSFVRLSEVDFVLVMRMRSRWNKKLSGIRMQTQIVCIGTDQFLTDSGDSGVQGRARPCHCSLQLQLEVSGKIRLKCTSLLCSVKVSAKFRQSFDRVSTEPQSFFKVSTEPFAIFNTFLSPRTHIRISRSSEGQKFADIAPTELRKSP